MGVMHFIETTFIEIDLPVSFAKAAQKGIGRMQYCRISGNSKKTNAAIQFASVVPAILSMSPL